MKKLSREALRWGAVTMAILLVFITLAVLNRRGKRAAGRSSYTLEAVVEDNTVVATEKLIYRNNSRDKLTEVQFCLYPNAFRCRENAASVAPENIWGLAWPEGFTPGELQIHSIEVNGNAAEWFTTQEEQILHVPLTAGLAPGASTEIYISFTDTLPYTALRFGQGENTCRCCNWYPIACVYDNGWQPCLYSAAGDPFYSECADYEVAVTAPASMHLATTGVICEEGGDPLHTTWRVRAENVRDFAFVLSENYQVRSRTVGDTVVYSYFLSEDEESGIKALDWACRALTVFGELFGPYPYAQFTVAEADFCIGGMEYPNLVLQDVTLYREENAAELEQVTAHETAHQWWYGMVGNDETREAWLDEALTQYSTALYYEKTAGAWSGREYLRKQQARARIMLDFLSSSGITDRRIDRPTAEFEDWLLYDTLVYSVGAQMFSSLRELMGEEAFFSALRGYCSAYTGKIAHREDLVRVFSSATGKDMKPVFDSWLDGRTVFAG